MLMNCNFDCYDINLEVNSITLNVKLYFLKQSYILKPTIFYDYNLSVNQSTDLNCDFTNP